MKYAIATIILIIALFYLFNFFQISEKSTPTETKKESVKQKTAKTPPPPPLSLKDQVKARFEKETVNGVVLAILKDQIILSKAHGFANQEKNIENKEETEFLVGSITKFFTATAILKLEELGKIDLKTPISTYLKADNAVWGDNLPSFANTITIHDLLTHTSGLEDYTKFASFTKFNLDLHTTAEIIQFFSDYPLKFKPGSQYDYSRSNYIILGAIIEEVSQKKYADFLGELFQPLAMQSTFIPKMDFLSVVLKNHPLIAIGYIEEKLRPNPQGIKKKLIATEDINLSTLFSDASAVSSAKNLQIWIKALFEGKIISNEQLKKMTTPYFETKTNGIFTGYGLFINNEDPATPIYINVGQLDGYEAFLGYEPKSKALIVVLTNVINGAAEPLAKDLMKQLIKN